MGALRETACRKLTTRASTRGFTLIELLAVIALLGVLAGVVFPLTEAASRRSKENEMRAALREIRTAIRSHGCRPR